MTKYKLALFDMDGTLLNGRTIFSFADTLGFKLELISVMRRKIQPFEKSILIGRFLKGYSSEELLDIYKKIPLQKDPDEDRPRQERLPSKGCRIAVPCIARGRAVKAAGGAARTYPFCKAPLEGRKG